MAIITALSLFFASLLGLVAGYLVASFASEELAYGMRYFVWVERVLLVLFFVAVCYAVFTSFSWLFLVISVLGFASSWLAQFPHRIVDVYLVLAFSLLFVITENVLFLMSSLGFLYGIVAGTMVKAQPS